jgi:(E)-4-hydroxy-3-methylbut-2-enyl-diphosphate synthase
VTARIKTRTEHLKGVKIAIMGCIVNGPGEMADADFRLRGRRARQDQSLRRQNADQIQHSRTEAVERLVDLIKEHHKWVEPELEMNKVWFLR